MKRKKYSKVLGCVDLGERQRIAKALDDGVAPGGADNLLNCFIKPVLLNLGRCGDGRARRDRKRVTQSMRNTGSER